MAFDVDFATVIELADSTYQSPSRAQVFLQEKIGGSIGLGKC